MKSKQEHLPRARELAMEDGSKPLAQASGFLTDASFEPST